MLVSAHGILHDTYKVPKNVAISTLYECKKIVKPKVEKTDRFPKDHPYKQKSYIAYLKKKGLPILVDL